MISARISYDLGESLLHHAIYFDEPRFTRDFLLWQHHRAMSRIRAVRDTLLDLVNARIVERLIRANGLEGEARLVAVEAQSQAELDELYEQARASSDRPFAFYEATVPAYVKTKADLAAAKARQDPSTDGDTNDDGDPGREPTDTH